MDEPISERDRMLEALQIELEYMSDQQLTDIYNQFCKPKKTYLGDGQWRDEDAPATKE